MTLTSNTKVTKLLPMDQIWPAGVSINKALLEHSYSHSFSYCIWLLSLQRHSWVIVTETIQPEKPRIFIEKDCWPVLKEMNNGSPSEQGAYNSHTGTHKGKSQNIMLSGEKRNFQRIHKIWYPSCKILSSMYYYRIYFL